MTRLAGHHCAFCGAEFEHGASWPRSCAGCGGVTGIGLVTLVLVVLRDEQGRVLVDRGHDLHEDARQELPARFLEFGETWRKAAARALGAPARFRALAARSDPEGVPRLYAEPEDAAPIGGRFSPATAIGDPFDREVLKAL